MTGPKKIQESPQRLPVAPAGQIPPGHSLAEPPSASRRVVKDFGQVSSTDLRTAGGSVAWSGLALALGPDRLVLSPAAAGLVVRLLDRVAKADGVRLSPAASEIRAAAVVVAMSSTGHGDVREAPVPAALPVDEIGTAEAAERLGLSARQVRRLVDDGSLGPARKVGSRLLISAAEVEAYRFGRSA